MILHPRRDQWASLKAQAVQAELPIPAIQPNTFVDDKLDVIIEGHCRCTGGTLSESIENASWYIMGIAVGRKDRECDSSVRS